VVDPREAVSFSGDRRAGRPRRDPPATGRVRGSRAGWSRGRRPSHRRSESSGGWREHGFRGGNQRSFWSQLSVFLTVSHTFCKPHYGNPNRWTPGLFRLSRRLWVSDLWIGPIGSTRGRGPAAGQGRRCVVAGGGERDRRPGR